MKLYIYESVGGITGNWHSDGGLAIITDRDPADAWRDYVNPSVSSRDENIPDECTCCDANDWHCDRCQYDDSKLGSGVDPDALAGKVAGLVVDIGDQVPAERIFVFPDAGCC